MVSSTISENTNIGPTFDVAAEHREKNGNIDPKEATIYSIYSKILRIKHRLFYFIHFVPESRKCSVSSTEFDIFKRTK